jgi:cytochrome c-type biogenesis protein CcmH
MILAMARFPPSPIPGCRPAPLAYTQLPDPEQEAEAKALMESLRCLVCQGQSIADSDAEMAGDMRALVRQRIAGGENRRTAIRKWLVQRYGDYVTYDPPFSWLTAPLWLLPLLLLGAGLLIWRGGCSARARRDADRGGRVMGWADAPGLRAVHRAGCCSRCCAIRASCGRSPATALMLGAAGYAWQGSPDLAGNPMVHAEKKGTVDAGLVEMREALFGRFNSSYAYFAIADAMTRDGSPENAAKAMLGAVKALPKDAALWTGLGTAMADRDGGLVTPAARLAFDRAIALAPQHPGPYYFLGVALIKGGQPAEARQYWAKAVQLAPPLQPYHDPMVAQLRQLDAFLASNGVAPPATQ